VLGIFAIVRLIDTGVETSRSSTVGFQNWVTAGELRFYAAGRYSLIKPPRTGRRWIRSGLRCTTG
jgi:hypothetical protein